MLSACVPQMMSRTPMTSTSDLLEGGTAKCLVVFLPGRGDTAEDFRTHGFISALREKNFPVDVVAADAAFGYYMRGNVIERLTEDVMRSAREKNYEHTWIVGISMGGMGALRYASENADQVDGMLLIAPFLGGTALTDEIRAAGGLSKWNAPQISKVTNGFEAERQMWGWLQTVTKEGAKSPHIYASWGTEDRFAPQVQLLAENLPKEHVMTMKGGHRWSTWEALFGAFLSDSEFTRACGR